MGIVFKHKGDFRKFTNYVQRVRAVFRISDLNKYGREGITALKAATPVSSGNTKDSWYYNIHIKKERATITFYNSNIQNGVPIAIILQCGHATRNGGWVEGVDYINPALKPIFDDIVNRAWREATRL